MPESLETLLAPIFGVGRHLSPFQSSMRAVAIFWLALALIRLSGRRSFGQNAPFDSCIVILLGATLSRVVVGVSPVVPTVCASFVLVLLHRFVGYLSVRSAKIDRIVGGQPRVIVRDGELDEEELRKALVTRCDLEEAARQRNYPVESLREVVLERTGRLSVSTSPRGERAHEASARLGERSLGDQ